MALANKESDQDIFLGHQENKSEKTVNKKIDNSRNINIENSTVNADAAGSFSQGDIQGTVANNINQETASNDDN